MLIVHHGSSCRMNRLPGQARTEAEMRRVFVVVAIFASWASFGCSASNDRPASSEPDCGCGEEPDASECDDTDSSDPDGGVPGWQMAWAAQAGGEEPIGSTYYPLDRAWDLQPLSDSSLLVTGEYVFEGVFGAGEPNETILPTFGPIEPMNTNDFLARYGLKGELLWAKGYGGPETDMHGSGISEEADGSFLTIGGYQSTATVGLGEANETTLVADTFDGPGMYSHLLARYSTDGELEWALRASDAAYDSRLQGFASLPDGSIVAAGYFSVGIAFAPGTSEETTFTTPASTDGDAVLARFAPDGALLWARRITGPGDERVYSIVRVGGGDLVVAGSYQQTVVLGEGEAVESSLTCATDDFCVFLAAYSEEGGLLWAKDAGFGADIDLYPQLAAAPDGGFALSGEFRGTAVLGAGETTETTFVTLDAEDVDVLVARFDGEGDLLWARQVSGPSSSAAQESLSGGVVISFLDDGELAVAGNYDGGPILFGVGEPNATELPHANNIQIFVALFYANGNLAWAIAQGGTSPIDDAMSVVAYGDSTFFVGGSFGSTVTFGTSSEDQKTMTANGDSDIFVLRFDRTEE
jgi:hypothetical protein